MKDILELAKKNGHKMGHIFSKSICFCKICDAFLYRSGSKIENVNLANKCNS